MEWNWRTLILLLGLMLIVGIMIDGIRRMRRNRELALRLDIDPNFVSHRDDQNNPELPNGGWRVAAHADDEPFIIDNSDDELTSFNEEPLVSIEPEEELAEPELAETATDTSVDIQKLASKPEDFKAPPKKVESRPVNLDELVPLLLDVEELGEEDNEPHVDFFEPFNTQAADIPEVEEILLESSPEAAETKPEAALNDNDETASNNDTSDTVESSTPQAEAKPESKKIDPKELTSPVNLANPDAAKLGSSSAELTLVIHCITPLGQSLDGKQVAHLFNSCDLRLGQDGIFHRYELAGGKGNIQFSVVHSYEPQTFNAETLLEQSFHGFSFFMLLPSSKEPLKAYETMLGLAKFIEQQYSADLYDADRSALTHQTIEHDRQQIIEFERRQQVAAKKRMRG